MAFLASNGALSDVLEEASKTALGLQRYAQRARDRAAAGPFSASEVLAMDEHLAGAKAKLQSYAAVDGIGAYAEANTPGAPVDYDVGAEWSAMMAAIDGVRTWIRGAFPVDANGFLLARQWGPDGTEYRSFTVVQTAGLRTQLDALIATIG